MLPIIYPYKMGSVSAGLLSSALGCRKVYPDRNYRTRRNHLVVNWGNSTVPNWDFSRMLNQPTRVLFATNKLLAFQEMFRHVSVPKFTSSKEEAAQWIQQGKKVVCRTVINGHSGQGIIVAQNVEELVNCKLYTELVRKEKEYRVHVFGGRVIDFVQKKKRDGVEVAPYIRTHSNGWVFCREGVTLPDNVAEEAIKAVKVLKLHFGAVDIAIKREDNSPVVFEVNTAPGIEGTTLEKYVSEIRSLL